MPEEPCLPEQTLETLENSELQELLKHTNNTSELSAKQSKKITFNKKRQENSESRDRSAILLDNMSPISPLSHVSLDHNNFNEHAITDKSCHLFDKYASTLNNNNNLPLHKTISRTTFHDQEPDHFNVEHTQLRKSRKNEER